ncbi:hypothetical protein ACWD3I_11695 [Streptomyces sp. NPDC002817]|uniref:hypothetical protein n=1 Tax=Streptomyces sp. NPDC088357 TaxID=3154655 RepID=UPI00342A0E23
MSSPDEYGNGAHDARDPQGPPNVYHPRTEPPPPYEEYADPAVAHGWQNAYDETAELPRVPSRRPRSRRRPTPWRSRRVALAAGAVGAVSAAALIAGFAFSGDGSAAGDAEGKHGRTGPSAADGSTEPGEDGTATGSDGTGSPDAGASPSGTAASSASPSPSAEKPKEPKESGQPPGASTTPSPTATASQSAPGNANGKGRGQGSTKGPK